MIPLAHPLTEPGGLPVPPLAVAAVVVALLAGATRWPAPAAGRRRAPGAPSDAADPAAAGSVLQPAAPATASTGALRPAQVATRAVGAALLVGVLVAGQVGSQRELANVAPALVVGLAWPGLLALSALLGQLWAWVDPWDALARLLSPLVGDDEPGPPEPWTAAGAPPVTWALVPAVAWVWYLSVFLRPLAPRSVGTALLLYTTVTLAGCLIVGRRAWLERFEVFGLLFTWVGRLRGGRLARWQPPTDADLVLGVLAGGVLFGALRLSTLWGSLNATPRATVYATLGLAVCCAAGAALLRLCERAAGRVDAPGSVVAAAVPAVAALAVALSLARNRLLVSAQLLPQVASDPLGRGWNLFGTAGLPVDPDPLGLRVRVAAQVLLLLGGAIAGLVVARGRTSRLWPSLVALGVLLAAGTLAVTAV